MYSWFGWFPEGNALSPGHEWFAIIRKYYAFMFGTCICHNTVLHAAIVRGHHPEATMSGAVSGGLRYTCQLLNYFTSIGETAGFSEVSIQR